VLKSTGRSRSAVAGLPEDDRTPSAAPGVGMRRHQAGAACIQNTACAHACGNGLAVDGDDIFSVISSRRPIDHAAVEVTLPARSILGVAARGKPCAATALAMRSPASSAFGSSDRPPVEIRLALAECAAAAERRRIGENLAVVSPSRRGRSASGRGPAVAARCSCSRAASAVDAAVEIGSSLRSRGRSNFDGPRVPRGAVELWRSNFGRSNFGRSKLRAPSRADASRVPTIRNRSALLQGLVSPRTDGREIPGGPRFAAIRPGAARSGAPRENLLFAADFRSGRSPVRAGRSPNVRSPELRSPNSVHRIFVRAGRSLRSRKTFARACRDAFHHHVRGA